MACRPRCTGPASWSATPQTGETQKYDGPYFFATYLRRLPLVSAIPMKNPDEVPVCLVPRDFVVDAMDVLSVQDRSIGRTPTPSVTPTAHRARVVDLFARHLHKRTVWVPLPLGLTRDVVAKVPFMEQILGLPAEALDYFVSPTVYDTTPPPTWRAPACPVRRSRRTPTDSSTS